MYLLGPGSLCAINPAEADKYRSFNTIFFYLE